MLQSVDLNWALPFVLWWKPLMMYFLKLIVQVTQYSLEGGSGVFFPLSILYNFKIGSTLEDALQ